MLSEFNYILLLRGLPAGMAGRGPGPPLLLTADEGQTDAKLTEGFL